MGTWIRTTDRLPENGTSVLTLNVHNNMRVLEFYEGFNCSLLPYSGTVYRECEITDIEYWMPLPELPTQREMA